MTIDVFTSAGAKKGTMELPASLFEVAVAPGLLHQAVMLQQSNRRASIAHAKARCEIRGSTRKLYAQKGTGRARRGAVRANILRGGNKAFGPKSNANFTKDMPREMRRTALLGSLSAQAKRGAIVGLENYPATVKTKDAYALLGKLPVDIGRHILFVLPEQHAGLTLSTRNIPRVKTILAQFLNPEDVLLAQHVIFLTDAIAKAEEIFGKRKVRISKKSDGPQTAAPEMTGDENTKKAKKTKDTRSTTNVPKKPVVKKSSSKPQKSL